MLRGEGPPAGALITLDNQSKRRRFARCFPPSPRLRRDRRSAQDDTVVVVVKVVNVVCDPFADKIEFMKKIISTPDAPAAVGPYSQAVRVGSTIYCAGQIPLDPKSGQIVSGDIAAQTRRVLDNVTAVLKAEGLTFENIVKTTIFLTNLADFQAVNETYGSYFKSQPPARSTVQVSALPKGANVEIEVIAVADEASAGGVAADTSG